MKTKLVRLSYFLFFFCILVQGATAAIGGGNLGTWYGYVIVDNVVVASNNTTVVSAYINLTSTLVGNTTVGAAMCELSNCTGFYYIDVQANEEDNITFKICGVNVSQAQQEFSAGPHSLLNLSINKSANGVICEYACGCDSGFSIDSYCCNSACGGGCNFCNVSGSEGTCTDVNTVCAGSDSSCYCSSGSCVACSSGYTCSSYECVATGGVSGGGGGGGAVSISVGSYVSLSKGETNITIKSITTSKKLIVTIAEYEDVAIRGINISVIKNIANIKIIISKISSLPSTIPYDISGKIYHYINIERINITDSDINTVSFEFAVNKTWLTNNNVDASNITLYRWANNQWNDLNAVKTTENMEEVFYNANSPGLSVFIIATRGGVPEPEAPTGAVIVCVENWQCTDWSGCIDSKQTRTCTDSNKCGTTVNKPLESKTCEVSVPELAVPLGLGVGLVTGILIIVIFTILKKKESKKKRILRMIS